MVCVCILFIYEERVMSIETLEKEIEELEAKLKSLIELKSKRMRQLDTEKSKLFIQLHIITKYSVQRCDAEGMPYLGHITVFGEWLADNSSKPWCCWNGMLYKTQEIVAGRMERYALGRYEDLSS